MRRNRGEMKFDSVILPNEREAARTSVRPYGNFVVGIVNAIWASARQEPTRGGRTPARLSNVKFRLHRENQ